MATYLRNVVFQSLLNNNVNNFRKVGNIGSRRIFNSVYKRSRNKIKSLSMCEANSFHISSCDLKRRKTAEERKSTRIIEYPPKAKGEIIDIWRGITLGELAKVYNKDIKYIYDIFLNQYQNPHIPITDIKVLQQAIHRSGKRMRIISKPEDNFEEEIKRDAFPRPPPSKAELKPRPPVVTVMGHIDHGKTTLLDALRNARVVDSEFGGITQHIGAFSVVLNSGACITFLDTPGHAAFSAMRSRGAHLTDIVVLVVAADDGVMEQTVESIRMARQARVPILVAINKIDSPKADIARTEKMLVDVGIQVENLGGDVQAIPISALKKQNLDQLVEALVLQADLLEVGGDPNGPVEAVVVESKVHRHRGKLCTVVVQRGTLKKGDILVAGTALAKVRALKDAEGKFLEQVGPGYPAEIEGWRELPSAGEQVLQVESEKRAREVLRFRENDQLQEKLQKDSEAIAQKEEQHEREYREKLLTKRKMGKYKLREAGPRKPEISSDDDGVPTLNIILKADVDGTLEAILDAVDTYESADCKMELVHYGVGSITETDIELAETFKGIIYAFNVELPPQLREAAENVSLKHHNIIYKLIDDIKEEINSRLPQKQEEEILGEATVLQKFEINSGRKKAFVAGCRCTKGLLKRTAHYRIMRKGEVIYTGTLSSMRHVKNEVDIIKNETECGLQFSEKELDFEAGDTIVCFEMKTVTQKTNWDPGF
nr:translation initiation factor IF-2, mitochondrial isoform X1 [Leptinotarsa decemlineata]